MKRHEKTLTLYYKMRKDRIHIDTICFIFLGIIITAAIKNQLEEKNKPKLGWKPFNNEYQDRGLNLTYEKTRRGKTRKRHENILKDKKSTL